MTSERDEYISALRKNAQTSKVSHSMIVVHSHISALVRTYTHTHTQTFKCTNTHKTQ